MLTGWSRRMQIDFRAGGSDWKIDNGVFVVDLKTTDDDGQSAEDTIQFTVPPDFRAHPDCVGAALSTLCGRKYARIGFDFPVSSRCKQMIETCYGVKVVSGPGGVNPRPQGKNLVLNFSGGFDSLAALLSVDFDVRMVSMDFGPPFEREKEYFATFDTVVCQTDFRKKGYGLNDWRFMAFGSLLLADYLDADLVGFGSILEAAPWQFSAGTVSGRPRPQGPFGAIGSADVAWTRPLTECATAMIVLSRAREAAAASLASLAAPGSEKLYRKQLLLDIASRRLGLAAPDRLAFEKPKNRVPWGRAFAVDFLALFFIQEYGRQFVEEWIDLPEDAEFRAATELNLDFYLKYNTNLIGYIPASIRDRVLNAFHSCGVYPYNEADFQSFDSVRRLLARHHPALRQ